MDNQSIFVRIKRRNGIWIASIRKISRELGRTLHASNNISNPQPSGQLTETTGLQYSMYSEDKFEWDLNKAASNLAGHGISFETAKGIFSDPDPIDVPDTRANYGEDRYIRIAMVEGKVLFVAYTERNGRIRLISARKAEKNEQDRYYRKKATGWEDI